MKLPVFSRLVLVALIFSMPVICAGAFDFSKLDDRVDLVLDGTSMGDAAWAIGRAAGVSIAAPIEPTGLTASWTGETLREVLNALAKISSLSWYIEDTVIVFKRPVKLENVASPPKEKLTPEQGMTALLASLSEMQLFYVSRGAPLSYADMTPDQQQTVTAILAPFADDVSVPKPEQTAVFFRVMPYLNIPATEGGDGQALPLDSTPYAKLAAEKEVMQDAE